MREEAIKRVKALILRKSLLVMESDICIQAKRIHLQVLKKEQRDLIELL